MAVRPPAGRRADRRCCWKEERIQGKRLDGFRNGEKEKKNLQSSRVHFVSRGHGGWVQKVSGFQVKMDRNFARFNTLRGSRSYSSPCLSLSVCRSPRPRARRVRGAAGWSNSSYSFCRRPVVPPNSLSLSLSIPAAFSPTIRRRSCRSIWLSIFSNSFNSSPSSSSSSFYFYSVWASPSIWLSHPKSQLPFLHSPSPEWRKSTLPHLSSLF